MDINSVPLASGTGYAALVQGETEGDFGSTSVRSSAHRTSGDTGEEVPTRFVEIKENAKIVRKFSRRSF